MLDASSRVESLTTTTITQLHIVGGGSKNALLNRFTANATQVPVLAGPVEATALGNILVQAITLGHVPSLAVGRGMIAQSFHVERIEPENASRRDAASKRFQKLCR